MDIAYTLRALEEKGYRAVAFDTGAEAVDWLASEIRGTTVCIGDSVTLDSIGAAKRLKEVNRKVFTLHGLEGDEFLETARESMRTECFLLSANAMTVDGVIVNIDGTGNRVAGSLFGHKRVFYVISTNKIAHDIDAAVARARHIAAPKNAARLGKATPCAKTGGVRCFDCRSPDRICRAVVIDLCAMSDEEVSVVLVKEQLGL